MFKKNKALLNFTIVLILWVICGYFFYLGWDHLIKKCTRIFNSEALFGGSITLGLFNGLTSCAILECIQINNAELNRNLIKIFFFLYIISIFSTFIFDLNWLFSMFSLFSIFGFMYSILNYEENNLV